MSFYAALVSFEQIHYAFAEKPEKLFWARLEENFFGFTRKQLEHFESREILCVHRSKTENGSTIRGYKLLRVFKFLFSTEAGTRKTPPCQEK